MKNIRIIIAMILSVACLTASAQGKVKVVDKSTKKVPTWVNGMKSDYIITSAIAPTIEAAKEQCMDNLRQQVIRAVAENVVFSSKSSIDQRTVDTGIESFLDVYSSSMKSQTADVPFIKGVSSSMIEEYYWEKSQNKKTGEVSYTYSVLYPFPSGELKRMVYEFEKRDKEMYDKYLALEAGLGKVSSVEEIDRSITEINPLISYFFDDTRKGAAKNLQSMYRKLYDNITFSTVSNKPGEYVMNLMLDGRPVSTSQRVTTKADCATSVMVNCGSPEIKVTYDYRTCYPGDENTISLGFKFGGKSVKHDFTFDLSSNEIKVSPHKTAYLAVREREDSIITQISVRLDINNQQKEAFTVTDMTLEVPGLSEPLFLDMLNTPIRPGNGTINVTWMGEVELLKSQNNRLNTLRGNMIVVSADGSNSKRVDFSLPFSSNW